MAKFSPRAIAGVITGVGFIGAGFVFHGEGGLVRGITTAGAVFAIAGVGIVVGSGRLALGCLSAALVLLVPELRNIPGLRRLDARRYESRFRDDYESPIALGHRQREQPERNGR
jgi:putative Mg2+ transporter-C (MgtC) family protein